MDKGKIFEDLVHMTVSNGIEVWFATLMVSSARIKGNSIALGQKLETIDDFNYNLAHERAHFFLHYNKGNIFASRDSSKYEQQAGRGVKMLLEALPMS